MLHCAVCVDQRCWPIAFEEEKTPEEVRDKIIATRRLLLRIKQLFCFHPQATTDRNANR